MKYDCIYSQSHITQSQLNITTSSKWENSIKVILPMRVLMIWSLVATSLISYENAAPHAPVGIILLGLLQLYYRISLRLIFKMRSLHSTFMKRVIDSSIVIWHNSLDAAWIIKYKPDYINRVKKKNWTKYILKSVDLVLIPVIPSVKATFFTLQLLRLWFELFRTRNSIMLRHPRVFSYLWFSWQWEMISSALNVIHNASSSVIQLT